jgi:hypothetical protein
VSIATTNLEQLLSTYRTSAAWTGRGDHNARDATRFHEMVRLSAPLSYPTRCRLVADEVQRQKASPSARATEAWLDQQLAVRAAVRGTVAYAALAVMQAEPGCESKPESTMAQLRSWTYQRLAAAQTGAWAEGAASWPVWALLMAPLPGDRDDLDWLAQSTYVGSAELAAAIGLTSTGALIRA